MHVAARLSAVLLWLVLFAGSAGAQERHGLGCLPTPIDLYNGAPKCRITATRSLDQPAHFTLEEYLPPIGDQGTTSACVSWATAYYCYSITVARQRKLTPEQRQDPHFLFSPAYIFHQVNNGQNTGTHIYMAFKLLADQGCATLALMPWDPADLTTLPSDEARARAKRYVARKTVALFRALGGGDAADPAKLRTWLWETKLPFVMGIPVYKDFLSVSHDPNSVYDLSADHGEVLGYHAVTVLGYDTDKHAFLMVNSWGAGWGHEGRAWLSEEFVTRYAVEGWAEWPGGPMARAARGAPPVAVTPDIQVEVPPTVGERR